MGQGLEHLFQYGDVKVRVVMRGDEPWFVAKDICDVLGLRTSNLRSVIDEEDITEIDPNVYSIDLADESGRGGRDMLLINESGMYTLVLKSRKPQAKTFKRWITHDVLPTLRRTGTYTISDRVPPETRSELANQGIAILERLKKGEFGSLERRQAVALQVSAVKMIAQAAETDVQWQDELWLQCVDSETKAINAMVDNVHQNFGDIDEWMQKANHRINDLMQMNAMLEEQVQYLKKRLFDGEDPVRMVGDLYHRSIKYQTDLRDKLAWRYEQHKNRIDVGSVRND